MCCSRHAAVSMAMIWNIGWRLNDRSLARPITRSGRRSQRGSGAIGSHVDPFHQAARRPDWDRETVSRLTIVDFPAPLGPTTPRREPARMSKETSRSTAGVDVWKRFSARLGHSVLGGGHAVVIQSLRV